MHSAASPIKGGLSRKLGVRAAALSCRKITRQRSHAWHQLVSAARQCSSLCAVNRRISAQLVYFPELGDVQCTNIIRSSNLLKVECVRKVVTCLKCGHCGVKDNKNVVAYWGYCNESRSTLLIFSQLCLRIELHVFLTHRVGLSSFHDIHTQCDGCGHYSGHWRGSRDGRGSRTEGRLQLKISK